MYKAVFATLLMVGFTPLTSVAATVNVNCTATIQSVGACSSSDAGKAGVLIAYWADLTDSAPTDPDVSSNAVDLKDAICNRFSIPASECTKEKADGALRLYLVSLVVDYRKTKKVVAIPAPVTPTLDAQGNP